MHLLLLDYLSFEPSRLLVSIHTVELVHMEELMYPVLLEYPANPNILPQGIILPIDSVSYSLVFNGLFLYNLHCFSCKPPRVGCKVA